MKYRDPKTGEVFEDIDTAIWNECRRRDPCDTNCPLFKLRKHIACRDYVISHPAEAARLMGLEVVEDTIPGVTQGVKSLFCEHIGVLPGQPFIVHSYPYRNYPPMVYGDDGCVRLCSPDGQKRHKVGGRAITWIVDHPESVEPCEGYTPQEVAFKKEDSMDKTDKPLSEWTLGEITKYCRKTDCSECALASDHPEITKCGIAGNPMTRDLTDEPRFTEEEVADAKSITRLIDGSTAAEIERMETGTLRLLIPLSVIGKKIIDLDCTIFPSLRPGQAVRLEAVVQ